MKNNILFFICFIITMISIVFIIVLKNSYALDYEFDNYKLFYKEDNDKLLNDIKIYLSDIDDYLFPNSSY